MSNESYQTTGQYNSIVGGVTEVVGNTVGATGLAQSGKDQKAQGDAEYKATEAKEYVDGAADGVSGKIDHVMGAVTGDTAQETQGKMQHDAGLAKQPSIPVTLAGRIREDQLTEFLLWDKNLSGDTYRGIFDNLRVGINTVTFKIHDADTHEIIEERTFDGKEGTAEYGSDFYDEMVCCIADASDEHDA